MASKEQNSGNGPKHEPSAMIGWGTLGGALLGAIIGGFVGHWVIWAFVVGTVGMTVGALVDRSRR